MVRILAQDCGHETGCDCEPYEQAHRTNKPSSSRWRAKGPSMGDAARMGRQSRIRTCPDCDGAGFHKVGCHRGVPT